MRCIALLIAGLYFSIAARAESIDLAQVKAAILQARLPDPPNYNDPDYPIFVALKAFLADQKLANIPNAKAAESGIR